MKYYHIEIEIFDGENSFICHSVLEYCGKDLNKRIKKWYGNNFKDIKFEEINEKDFDVLKKYITEI